MRMRTLIHLVLACLLIAVVVAPGASADDGHDRHDRHDRRGSSSSFLGVPAAESSCSREGRSCDFVFSRSVSAKFHQRLAWVLTENLDAMENLAAHMCSRAEKENECAGSFMAGLWNGLDALEIAVSEASCATLHLAWRKGDGLSQTWGITNGESCTD